jgi:SNF2 family DNA or RNA helicase
LLAQGSIKERVQRQKVFRDEASKGQFWKSSKLLETIRIINKRLIKDPVGKILVFCFSLVILDILEIGLGAGTPCLRYDGSVTRDHKAEVIASFQNSSLGPRVILVTSSSGGV